MVYLGAPILISHLYCTIGDYSSVTRTLTFPSADSEFFVDVPITNDNLFENTESFTAKIDQSTPDSDVSIPDATSVATVMILNDDRKCHSCILCM